MPGRSFNAIGFSRNFEGPVWFTAQTIDVIARLALISFMVSRALCSSQTPNTSPASSTHYYLARFTTHVGAVICL